MDNTECWLVERAITGDTSALNELLMQKSRKILYLAYKAVGNMQDAEDVAQESMLQMHRGISRLRSPELFDAWLGKVVYSTCIHMDRKTRRHRKEFSIEMAEPEMVERRNEFLPEEYAQDAQKRQVLMDIVDELNIKYRTCLVLFYFNDYSYAEIASTMSLTPKQVENALVRGRDAIRKKLEQRTHTRLLLENAGIVALPPVLARAFLQDADKIMPTEMAERIMNQVMAQASNASAAWNIPAKHLGRVGLRNVPWKVIIGVAAAGGIIAAGFLANSHMQKEDRVVPPTFGDSGFVSHQPTVRDDLLSSYSPSIVSTPTPPPMAETSPGTPTGTPTPTPDIQLIETQDESAVPSTQTPTP